MKTTAKQMKWKHEDLVMLYKSGRGRIGGDKCHKCDSTANVVHPAAGWLCPCGHYIVLSWSHIEFAHDNPTYGPTQLEIERAVEESK